MRNLGFTKSKLDPALYLFFKPRSNQKVNPDEDIKREAVRKQLSMQGLIQRSLIDYIDPKFYADHELIGVCGVYVDDTLIAGTQEFYDGPARKMLDKYDIEKVDELPVKFLGGVLKYTSEDLSSISLDYSAHLSKVECIKEPAGADMNSLVDHKTHNGFRWIHGSLNFFVSQGYPLASYELSESWSGVAHPTWGHVHWLNKLIRKIK